MKIFINKKMKKHYWVLSFKTNAFTFRINWYKRMYNFPFHDHDRDFWSILLWGWYAEYYPKIFDELLYYRFMRLPLYCVIRRKEQVHKVVVIKPCLTLTVSFGEKQEQTYFK